MIGIDANILLRYFAQDDPIQSPQATHLLERRLTTAEPGYISLAALMEVVWTLITTYKRSNEEVVFVLEKLLTTETFRIQHAKQVFRAMHAFAEGSGFADALIGALGIAAGCTYTLTFDKKAARLPAFRLL